MTEKRKFHVLLPKTEFPMKADLPAREPGFLAQWEKLGLYGRMLDRNKGREPFVLHDGPPYANGKIHVGHALNKILKDVIVKAQSMKGRYAPYIPGWDCHGLPIEHALMKEKGWSKRSVDRLTLRREAARYAEKWIEEQKRDFKRLGVLGDWDHPYKTLSPEYEAGIARTFFDLFEKGCVVQDKKPVYWCAACETALAEAEVEYEEKTDTSIFLKFPVAAWPGNPDAQRLAKAAGKRASVLVWTTTPWTLPANVALAFHPEQQYRLYENKRDHEVYVVGKPGWLLCQELFGEGTPLAEAEGLALEGLVAKNPVNGNDSQGILAEFVSDTDGTGVVHIAPGHGAEDYAAGRTYGLPTVSPVDAAGAFTGDVQPQWLKGKKIWDANPEIIAQLEKDRALLKAQPLAHSYPHCWRCKNPILFRATEQWFLKVTDGLRAALIASTDTVKWIPDYGKDRILSMLKTRPDWCLSRQRYWGAPIPMFVDPQTKKPLVDKKVFDHVVELFRKHGSDVWYEKDVKDLLPPGTAGAWKKEEDILDVWFDSGASWKAVLDARDQTRGAPREKVMYLEGSDQHRGWFQTSLLPAVAVTGRPPFGTVLTHGFVLDGQGKAMSKSAGNVVSPQEVIQKYGADVLRLWVAMTDYREDVRLSPQILERVVDTYRKIRNTLRFLLGNLSGLDPKAAPALRPLDAAALGALNDVIADVSRHYDDCAFHLVTARLTDHFCITVLSEYYLDVQKDALYCERPDSPRRRSAQYAFLHITKALARMLAPVLSFTAEETWQELRAQGLLSPEDAAESVFLNAFPAPVPVPAGAPAMADLLRLRRKASAAIEPLRQAGQAKGFGDVRVTVPAGALHGRFSAEEWSALLGPAEAAAADGDGPAQAAPATGEKCPRCWITRPLAADGLCARCADAEKALAQPA